ncbi:MAG: hypothetical protein ABJ286_10970 [Parasphingorhabdus sp.]
MQAGVRYPLIYYIFLENTAADAAVRFVALAMPLRISSILLVAG